MSKNSLEGLPQSYNRAAHDTERVFLCFPDNLDQLNFYLNLRTGLQAKNIRLYLLTADAAVYDAMRIKGIADRVLLKKNAEPWIDADLCESREIITGQLDKDDAAVLYTSAYNAVKNFHERHRIDKCFFGGGSRVVELAVARYADEQGIAKVYFELANIKGKTFMDKQGANAKSWLYDHIEILDQYHFIDAEYEAWRQEYLTSNFKKHVVKQAVSYTKLKWRYGLMSRLGFLYTGLKIREIDLGKKLRSFLTAKFGKPFAYDKVDLSNTKYYFFPMQVSNDMQIVLNSDIGLFEGLKVAIKEAKDAGVELVVKLHPAEPYLSVIEHLLELRKEYGFKIVQDNTFDVIANAVKVITINSTVGLESMILQKPVQFLGRSFYKELNKERLKNYIMGYLLDLDIFSDREFTLEEVGMFLHRLERMAQ